MEVKIVNKSAFDLPQYATIMSAGMDLKANITEPVVLDTLERAMVPTGLYIELPDGKCMLIDAGESVFGR